MLNLSTFSAVKVALNAAYSRGIKRPALHVYRDDNRDFKFKRAPDIGRNPSYIYVTRNSFGHPYYIGKISPDGMFSESRDCQSSDVAALTAIAADPLQAARDSGKLTGRCACCGKELSDPVSIQGGIGPICARKYFDTVAL